MINAVVENKHGETAVIDLTSNYHVIYRELRTAGYQGSNQMKINAAETRLTFYCPLTASIDDGEEYGDIFKYL